MRSTIDAFFERANYLNGLLYHLEAQLELFRNSFRTNQQNVIPYPGAFSSLLIRDLTERPSHGWQVPYQSGAFSTSGEAFLDLVDILLAREAAWATANGFEAFETCVKDLLVDYYLAVPSSVKADRLSKEEQNLKKKGLMRGSREFWSTYVRRNFKSADKALDEIRRVARQLEEAEQHNSYRRDLIKWFTLVSEVRHAVVHSNLTIVKSRWDSLTSDPRFVPDVFFSGVLGTTGYELRPSVEQATNALTGLLEYGYAAFKALSIAGQTDWCVFPQQGQQ